MKSPGEEGGYIDSGICNIDRTSRFKIEVEGAR
jgi:hypothetical protein